MKFMKQLRVDSSYGTLSDEVWKAIDPYRRTRFHSEQHPAYRKLFDPITASMTDVAHTHGNHLGATTDALLECLV